MNKPFSKDRLKKLYEELGEVQIENLLKIFYDKLSQDILVGFFFNGKDLQSIIKMQKALLLRSAGATSSYSGKSPATAHLGLAPILKGHFDRRLVLLRETLTEAGLHYDLVQTWVDFENQFRKAIVAE